MRAIAITLLVAGCGIKLPPFEPNEPPRTWAKPSVQRDCDHECSDVPAEYRANCMWRCESPPQLLKCGGIIHNDAESLESGLPRIAAIVFVAGWLVATTLVMRGDTL